ncbi:MAG: SDR family oxidoreductase, partial [Deltaproteobacteria bacterium]|nr:SDR family oxidoreductase [Deltaproteobacteria bacterium]
QVANTLDDAENEQLLEKWKHILAKATPLLKSGLAKDIATAALYLASDEGSFVTCHDFVVDGGRTAAFHEA